MMAVHSHQQEHQRKLLPKDLSDYVVEEIAKRNEGLRPAFERYDYTHGMDMLRRRQEIACYDAILVKERERHGMKQMEFRKRWQAAAKQLKRTDEAIVSLDQYYQDSVNEKQHLLQIAANQDDIRKGKERDIERLNKEKTVLSQALDRTKQRLDRFQPVKKYLERVRDTSKGEFGTIRELLDRFTLLKFTRDELLSREEKGTGAIQKHQDTLESIRLYKQNEAVLLNNHVFEIREELERMEQSLMDMEFEFNRIKTTASKGSLHLGKIRTATYNLYIQACRLLDRPPAISPSDTIQQMEYIQGGLIEMTKLRKELQNAMRRARVQYEKEKHRKSHLEHVEKLKQARATGKRKTVAGIFGFTEGPSRVKAADRKTVSGNAASDILASSMDALRPIVAAVVQAKRISARYQSGKSHVAKSVEGSSQHKKTKDPVHFA